MQGLVIWAHSYCRSTLGFFRGLGKAFGVPLKLCIWKENAKIRTNVGFTESEFDDLDITFVGNNYELAFGILNEHKHYHHIFGAYQSVRIYQDLIIEAKSLGCKIGIASEAPCNMTPGINRLPKELYIKYLLPFKVKKQIKAADFIINLSGADTKPLENIGWPYEKIIPCGYYSPKIEKATVVKRTEANWDNFTILLTGLHQWHRSPMLLIKALYELKKQGLTPKCYITQSGPLLNDMKRYAEEKQLSNISFLGFVKMERLVELYETCSVYIGTGNYEPWGMRLNDALNCGAPLIVNKGMGGYKMIEDYSCGLTFEHNDYCSLASKLKLLITDMNYYLKVANNAYEAVTNISPDAKALEVKSVIHNNYIDW